MKLGLQSRALVSGSRCIELYFGDTCIDCEAPVILGQRRCPKHLEAQKAYERRGFWRGRALDLLLRPCPPPPWAVDPSLLPKRPPTVGASP